MTSWTEARQASLSSTNSWSLLGVLARLGGSVRLGALLPRAPAAHARARAALARASLAPRLPHNLSLELVAAATPARDPASLASGVCQVLTAPGVAALIAFPETRPELLQLHFLASATETPVLSVLRRQARAPLGSPVRAGIRGRMGEAPGSSWGLGSGGLETVLGTHGTRTSGPEMGGDSESDDRGPGSLDHGCPWGSGSRNGRREPRDRRDLEPRTCGSGPRGTPLDSRRRIPQGASLGLGGVDPLGPRPPCRVRGRLRIPTRQDRKAGMGKRVSLPTLQGQQFQRLKLEAFLPSASSDPRGIREAGILEARPPPPTASLTHSLLRSPDTKTLVFLRHSSTLEFIVFLFPPPGWNLGPNK